MNDSRNVIDEFKGMAEQDIIVRLDQNGSKLEVAVENTLRDFNMGTIVRSANAFGIRTVHIVGRKQWNKRGAMATDKYLHVIYHDDFSSLASYAVESGRGIIAVDNVLGAKSLQTALKPSNAILLFGQEGPGLSDEALSSASSVVAIEQYGSTRSLNVGVAAGIVLYAWIHGQV